MNWTLIYPCSWFDNGVQLTIEWVTDENSGRIANIDSFARIELDAFIWGKITGTDRGDEIDGLYDVEGWVIALDQAEFQKWLKDALKVKNDETISTVTEEWLIYALQITAPTEYRLTQEQIVELICHRFPGCRMTKDSKEKFEPIWLKIKETNTQYKSDGRIPALPVGKLEELVATSKKGAAAISQPLSEAVSA